MTCSGESLLPSAPLPTPESRFRLLPWTSPDGRPCYLSADNPRSRLSRLADDVEAAQLSSGAQVLGGAEAVLADPRAGVRELRFTTARLTESLRDALRVADSRGGRLPVPTEPEDGG
ncbi:hypothetical protein ACFYYR_13475 [Streptomyces sp. NPDC001922]|uniref:hypothetical protein n=1 Tax=Streptomyces sp. NPDC001922 TaxID=3364624 RepID=UPI0036B54B21